MNQKPTPSLRMSTDWLISLSDDMRCKTHAFFGESRENCRKGQEEQ